MTATYRNRKNGKLVVATFNPASNIPESRRTESTCDQYVYYSLRDGKRFGPVMVKVATRFLELYEEVK
jgi:hypothetical protein